MASIQGPRFSWDSCIAMMIAPQQMRAALLPAVAKHRKALADDLVRCVPARPGAIALAHRAGK
ncbi:hypothetical protein CIC12_31045 [Burkholderia sp. SG-MS1]|uniref:hypothetical protein n=1 Tax=Paraburkholderia sp. SG-MS1 TaxID=2023741 RepID=UPI001447A2CF|nr:hypothetical protein [Paraburkholderia sp. SG-MS1]NKJ51080.1 hypothetical protein [Paraburkholderia sp. SG-MS1]